MTRRNLIGQPAARVNAELQRVIDLPKRCILCGTWTRDSGVFEPFKPEAWGARPQKTRYFVYGICQRCQALPDVTQRIEAVLMQDLVEPRN